MQHRIQVRLLFGADAVAAHFAMGDRLQIHHLDQLVHCHFIREVGLVAQYQQGDAV